MKKIYSLIACIIISITLVQYRVSYSDIKHGNAPLKITMWDAFGYYTYLPAICIYHDCKQLEWLTDVDKKYSVTGGNGWQAQKAENGNYAFKYLGGVAILELPFFCTGHIIAKHYGYPTDGFSPPYQYALGFGIIIYCILAIFLLRSMLLLFFGDIAVAISLILLCLATNFIQYAAIDNGQSHAYLFLLYALVIYTTIKWHKKPAIIWAILTGYIIGFATICRPTEAIMLLIPLLWNTQNKTTAKEKWLQVRQNKHHIIFAGIFGIIGILPQLIYWKYITGSFFYDVGSKWEFLNPHFRVLFGWEKGWFIYTPATILFIIGLFFIKRFPFRKSVMWFCLLNIYIIIAWHDWRYGGSYSTRALVESYPVFSLPLAALVEKIIATKWRFLFYPFCAYLVGVNCFQIYQYNDTILLFDGMNKAYYGRIYLNLAPSPIDMSLLDNDEVMTSENGYHKQMLLSIDTTITVAFAANRQYILKQVDIACDTTKDGWVKIESLMRSPGCLWPSFMNADIQQGDSIKHAAVRLYSPISKDAKTNAYVFYVHIPKHRKLGTLKVYIGSSSPFTGTVDKLVITRYEK